MSERHEVGRELTAEQRTMYFQLGSEIQAHRTMRLGFRVDADKCHRQALSALRATNWRSVKTAKSVLFTSRVLR